MSHFMPKKDLSIPVTFRKEGSSRKVKQQNFNQDFVPVETKMDKECLKGLVPSTVNMI